MPSGGKVWMNELCVYTIGHSNHTMAVFLSLLKRHSVEEIVDVRSAPYSRVYTWFSRPVLAECLRRARIAYTFLGDKLGARPADPHCYTNGRAEYALIARSSAFRTGIEQVQRRAAERRVALLCAEREPLDCHRSILIAPTLIRVGVRVRHILADGSVEDHHQTEERLLTLTDTAPTLFGPRDRATLLETAYDKRASEICYVQPSSEYRDDE